jgi:hypothetical protein
VGILAAVLAVGLAIVTIASHRTHTAAIMHKSTANDEWAYYQATRIKLHNVELGEQLAGLFNQKDGAAAAILAASAGQKQKYLAAAKEIQHKADQAEGLATAEEDRALRYDVGEGLMEIALVLSSLYFISKKKMFPAMGIAAGLLGAVIAITGLFM